MSIEDLSKKASDLAGKAGEFVNQNSEKIQEVAKSEQAEEISDKVLDGVAGFADKITGGKFSEKIADARDSADGAIGNE
ncbi:Rv0909 family putative TA system antitoxin [Leucobacter sp. NPDC058333]|uniref:Rv0909 family putative TA system antitoxin n=1 Tax=Leucobacter sp. NPDC058333 TaxID=3346450 RepID=UPI00365FD76F